MKTIFRNLILSSVILTFGSVKAQTWSWVKQFPSTGAMEAKGIATDNYRNNFIVNNFSGTGTFGSTTLISSGGSYDVALSKVDENNNYLWTVAAVTGTGYDQGTAVICDPTGADIYVTGQFYGTATFGGTTTLTSSGNADVFIAKFNSSGTLVWAVQAGGVSSDECYDIAWGRCTGSPCKGTYVFITGRFQGTATFGTNSITAPGGNAMFTAFYSGGTGANVWVKQASSSSNSVNSAAITSDAANNVYVTGLFYGTATFGSLSLTATSNDQFVLKYNSAGTEQWVRQGGGTSIDYGCDLRVDASGNVYVAGEYASGTATYGAFTLTGGAGFDIAVVKYNSSGTEQWAAKAGGSNGDHVSGIALDVTGAPYITGYIGSNTASFGSIPFTADANGDPYVARLTTSGIFDKVASPVGSPSYAVGRPDDIAVSVLGHVFIVGDFQYSFTFGSTTINSGGPQHGFAAKLKPGDWPVVEGGTAVRDSVVNMDVDPSGNSYICGFMGNSYYEDGFIKKYNSSGIQQWTNFGYHAGSPFATVAATAVAADASGNVYSSGLYTYTATFGSTTLTMGTSTIFLVKYNSAGVQQWAIRAADHAGVNDMTTDAAGNVLITGTIYGSALFGNGTNTVTLTSNGAASDGFIARYDSNGNLLMAVNACSGTGTDVPTAIVMGGNDIFLSGHFNGTNTQFGSTSVLATSNANSVDMFVAKYNSSGVGQAVIAAGSASADYLWDISYAAGNIYTSGSYQGTVLLGSIWLFSSGSWDGLVAKINPSAMTVSWVREVKGSSAEHCRDVEAVNSGVLVGGNFYSPATFGDGTTTFTLSSAGSDDMFVEKFDNAGTYQWIRQIGGSNRETSAGLGADGSECAYVSGNIVTSTVIDGTNYAGSYFVEKLAFDDGTFARMAEEGAVAEVQQYDELTVYPNPFSDYTTFRITGGQEGNYTLVLYDVNGKEVIRQAGIITEQIVLSREGLTSGLYMYMLYCGEEKPHVGKLLIE